MKTHKLFNFFFFFEKYIIVPNWINRIEIILHSFISKNNNNKIKTLPITCTPLKKRLYVQINQENKKREKKNSIMESPRKYKDFWCFGNWD